MANPPFPNADSYHRIQQFRSTEIDVSGATATQAVPLVLAGDFALDIYGFWYVPRVTTDNAALTINIGVVGTLTQFGTITVPIGSVAGVPVRGNVTEANRIIAIDEAVVVGHTQSASNTGDGTVFLNCGFSGQ